MARLPPASSAPTYTVIVTDLERWNRLIREVHPTVYLVGGIVLIAGGIALATGAVAQGIALDWDWSTEIEHRRRLRRWTTTFAESFAFGLIVGIGLVGLGVLVIVQRARLRSLPPLPDSPARHRR